MKKLILVGLVLLSGACNVREPALDFRRIPEEKLSGEIVDIGDSVLAPRQIFDTRDHFVIFDDNKNDHFLKYFSKATGGLDFKFGIRGNGPNEFIMPRIIPSGEGIGVLALNKFVFLRVEGQELIKKEKKIRNREKVTGANCLFFLDDSRVLYTKSSESQFHVLDDRSGRESAVDAYPLPYENKYPRYFVNNVVFDAHYSYHENEDFIFAAYKHVPVVSLIPVPEFQDPLHVYLNTGDKNEIVRKDNHWIYDDPIYYYTFTDVSSGFCYALFQHADKSALRENKQKSEIHVFDFQGKMVRRLGFDIPIYHFAASGDDTELYALSLNDDFLPEVWKYDL